MTAARNRTATNLLPRIAEAGSGNDCPASFPAEGAPASISSGRSRWRGSRLRRHGRPWKPPGEPEREQRQRSDGSQRFPEGVELGIAVCAGDRGGLVLGKPRVARALLDIRHRNDVDPLLGVGGDLLLHRCGQLWVVGDAVVETV